MHVPYEQLPIRPLTRIVALGVALLLLGVVRARDDLNTDRASTWIYLGAEVALFALLAWLIVTMSRRRGPATDT